MKECFLWLQDCNCCFQILRHESEFGSYHDLDNPWNFKGLMSYVYGLIIRLWSVPKRTTEYLGSCSMFISHFWQNFHHTGFGLASMTFFQFIFGLHIPHLFGMNFNCIKERGWVLVWILATSGVLEAVIKMPLVCTMTHGKTTFLVPPQASGRRAQALALFTFFCVILLLLDSFMR